MSLLESRDASVQSSVPIMPVTPHVHSHVTEKALGLPVSSFLESPKLRLMLQCSKASDSKRSLILYSFCTAFSLPPPLPPLHLTDRDVTYKRVPMSYLVFFFMSTMSFMCDVCIYIFLFSFNLSLSSRLIYVDFHLMGLF